MALGHLHLKGAIIRADLIFLTFEKKIYQANSALALSYHMLKHKPPSNNHSENNAIPLKNQFLTTLCSKPVFSQMKKELDRLNFAYSGNLLY